MVCNTGIRDFKSLLRMIEPCAGTDDGESLEYAAYISLALRVPRVGWFLSGFCLPTKKERKLYQKNVNTSQSTADMLLSSSYLRGIIKLWSSVLVFLSVLFSSVALLNVVYNYFGQTVVLSNNGELMKHVNNLAQLAPIRINGHIPSKIEHCVDASSNWDKILKNTDTVTADQIMEYFLWANRTSCKLAHDIGGVMLNNPSGVAGQKTVCLDPEVALKPKDCLVYSFGISDEWSFDEQMERYGCEVFAFDPSMGVDHHDHSPGIHFYNWGLANRDEFDAVENWTMRSLSSIYNSLSTIHGPNKIIDYLKIDVEYSEWVALPEMISSGMLSKVRQLGMEVHLDDKESLERHREWTQLLRSIETMGMIRFDSKYNLWSMRNFTKFHLFGPIGHEIAWYNSKLIP